MDFVHVFQCAFIGGMIILICIGACEDRDDVYMQFYTS